MKKNKIFLTVIILLSFVSQLFSFQNNFKGIWQNEKCVSGEKNWLVLRVEFQEDTKSITTGTGNFYRHGKIMIQVMFSILCRTIVNISNHI